MYFYINLKLLSAKCTQKVNETKYLGFSKLGVQWAERDTNFNLESNDLSFASTETKFKNPITKTQNNFLVNTAFLVKLFQKNPKW